jgi:hypothetical protein
MQQFDFDVTYFLPTKDNPFYKYTTDCGCQPEFRATTNYDELFKMHDLFGEKYKALPRENNCKIKLIIYTRPLDMNCGGIVALHNLAKIINDMKNPNICAKLFIFNGLRYTNKYCQDFASIEEAADDNAIVIYPEIITGNPLNCKKVIRWILLSLGKEMSSDHYKNWSKNDLVYYFNSELKFEQNPEKMGTEYKLLNCLSISQYAIQVNFGKRVGICYAYRKSNDIKNMHNRETGLVHPSGSIELTREHNQIEHIRIFNKCRWFMCYDPLTFYAIIAAVCGCIPVIYKIHGTNKQEWIQTTAASAYVRSKGLDNLYGIAYGEEDMQYAADTIHLAKGQWEDILKFNIESNVIPFVNDIQHFYDMPNKVATFYNE